MRKSPEGPPYQEMEPKMTIIIIDDDEGTAISVARLLELHMQDPRVIIYTRAEDAVENIEKSEDKPSVVLIDGMLIQDNGEYQNGANVVEKLRDLLGNEVIIVAFSSDDKLNQEMLSAGADVKFQKPTGNFQKLVKELKNRLNQSD